MSNDRARLNLAEHDSLCAKRVAKNPERWPCTCDYPTTDRAELISRLRRVEGSSDLERWTEAREAINEAAVALADTEREIAEQAATIEAMYAIVFDPISDYYGEIRTKFDALRMDTPTN